MSYSAYHIGSAHFLHNKSLAVLLFLNSALLQCLMLVVLGNPILPRLYCSPEHSEQDVSSVVIHCRKFFSHSGFLYIRANAKAKANFFFDLLPLTHSCSINTDWKQCNRLEVTSLSLSH